MEPLEASLAGRLAGLTFVDRTADEVTALIIDAVAAWVTEQGWRVYRRARSVVPLPPPYERRHSIVDIACARPDGPPVVIEVDHGNRRRTVDKLLAEAEAGRIPIWVRWGVGPFAAPPPIRMVTLEVTSRPGTAGKERLHARLQERPAPEHSAIGAEAVTAVPLPIPHEDTARDL
jgi:hypothetical protein